MTGVIVKAKREPSAIAGISVAVAMAALLAGCSSTTGSLFGGDRARANRPVAMATQPAVSLTSSSLVEDGTAAGQPAAAAMSAAVSQAPGYRNLNVPDGDVTSRLLTEEEKAAAILELEELARRQAQGMTKPL
jgi:hypothetical protein